MSDCHCAHCETKEHEGEPPTPTTPAAASEVAEDFDTLKWLAAMARVYPHWAGSASITAAELTALRAKLAEVEGERDRLRAEHDEGCDVRDQNAEGITKPCNCFRYIVREAQEYIITAESALAASQAEVERLKKRAAICDRLADRLPLCPDHRDKQGGKSCLACEVERLRGALEEYGCHHEPCPVGVSGTCTCGMNAALAGGEK